ncbi:hypothetical protein D3C71_1712560 [compost metagenome]
MLDARLDAGARHRLGGQDVVAHRFTQLALQHRHLLVGGGMEDRIDAGQRQRMADHRRVAAIAEHRLYFQVGEAAGELGLDGQQQQLAHFQQHDAPGPMARALAAQLRTDRATGAGDQHRAPTQPTADQRPVRQDRLAPQQVLDRHFLELAGQ